MPAIKEYIDTHSEQLDLFTTAITRAHGKNHPEAFEVRDIYKQIEVKVKETANDALDLEDEFTQMRKVTNDYTIPNDVCETYAAVYTMLSEADTAYYK